MNRMLLTTVMSAMLAIAAPGVASAHNAKRHHHARHSSARHHHARHASVRTFGSPLTPAGSTTTTPPTTPASGATAGTVMSFTGGVLTITLTNGTTVSGQVTDRTEIRCLPSTPPPAEGEDGDDDAGGPEGGEHGGPAMSGRGDSASHDDMGGGDDANGGGQPGSDGAQSCTSAALVAGAVVREAELSVSSAGAVWDHVNLIG